MKRVSVKKGAFLFVFFKEEEQTCCVSSYDLSFDLFKKCWTIKTRMLGFEKKMRVSSCEKKHFKILICSAKSIFLLWKTKTKRTGAEGIESGQCSSGQRGQGAVKTLGCLHSSAH